MGQASIGTDWGLRMESAKVTPPGTGMSALGLTMIASAPALMLVSALLFGMDVSDDYMFFLIPIVAAGGGSWVARRPGVWPRIVTILVAMMTAMMLFWTIFSITALGSFFDFVPAILVLPGLAIAIAGAVKALRARRTPDAAPDPRERTFIRSVVIVVAALTAVSAITTFATRSSADPSSAAERIVMKDFTFDPDSVSVSGGETLHLKNSDPFLHTFTIDALDIDVTFGPGSSKLVTIPADAGEYVFYCTPHTGNPEDPSGDDMGGRLTVT